MFVLVVVVLALKLVQSGVHHTFGGGHDIVFTSPYTSMAKQTPDLIPMIGKEAVVTKFAFLLV